jgi:hypothetical protein
MNKEDVKGQQVHMKCEAGECQNTDVLDYDRIGNERLAGWENEPIALCRYHGILRIPIFQEEWISTKDRMPETHQCEDREWGSDIVRLKLQSGEVVTGYRFGRKLQSWCDRNGMSESGSNTITQWSPIINTKYVESNK